jgi:predicted amidohydrolase YtcJ
LLPSSSERYADRGQPDHLLDDANSVGKKIGTERAERSSYTFRSLLAGGARLAFGSDWPVRDSEETCSITEIYIVKSLQLANECVVYAFQVSDINPLQAMHAAMFRKPPGWDAPWIPAQRLSLDDSLKA